MSMCHVVVDIIAGCASSAQQHRDSGKMTEAAGSHRKIQKQNPSQQSQPCHPDLHKHTMRFARRYSRMYLMSTSRSAYIARGRSYMVLGILCVESHTEALQEGACGECATIGRTQSTSGVSTYGGVRDGVVLTCDREGPDACSTIVVAADGGRDLAEHFVGQILERGHAVLLKVAGVAESTVDDAGGRVEVYW